MKLKHKSNQTYNLLVRDALVVISAIGFVITFVIAISRLFHELSYLLAVATASGSVIIFGWSCYMGHAHRQQQQFDSSIHA